MLHDEEGRIQKDSLERPAHLIGYADERWKFYKPKLDLRAASLFGGQNFSDPMELRRAELGPNSRAERFQPARMSNRNFSGVGKVPPFALNTRSFLSHAQDNAPGNPEATASGFSSWVYSLYGMQGQDPTAMQRGIDAELDIFLAKHPAGPPLFDGARKIVAGCDNRFLYRSWSDWKLIHRGLRTDPDVETIPFYEIESLTVRGRPMGASPDLIYRNERTGEVIIVEVKFSRMPIPPNLWPNVWAQLWCYSKIPIVSSASKITAVGEIWGEISNTFGQGRRKQTIFSVGLRASVRRDPKADAYDRFFRALFDIYRGD